MNLREQILQSQDLKKETVQVPEWGCDVTVTEMSGLDRDSFERSIAGTEGTRNLENLRSRLLVKTLVDGNGERMFADDEADLLGKKSATVLAKLFEVAQKINGLGIQEQEAIEKN